jgi:hypothetical protein
MGNALIVDSRIVPDLLAEMLGGVPATEFKIITDYGNEIWLTEGKILGLFYIGGEADRSHKHFCEGAFR